MLLNTRPMAFSGEGYHVARCIGIVQLGTIFIVDKWQAQVRVSWELPFDLREFKRGSEPAPKQMSKEYASSLYGKSWLKRHLTSWLGEAVNLDGLNMKDLLGVPCKIKIEHRRSNTSNAWYEDITDVIPCAEADCPPQFNKSRILTFDDFDQKTFNELPAFVAQKIMRSKEFVNMGIMYNPSRRPVQEDTNPF